MNSVNNLLIGDQLELLDPVAFRYMKDTPWLDSLIEKNAYDIGQNGSKKYKKEHLPLQKVAGLWLGLAINQNQRTSGGAHRDERDTKKGYNCVVPYGEWDGGDLLLWEIRQRIGLRQGQALFFRGNLISHNAWGIKGTRNCVDLFTHENMLRKDIEKRKHDRSDAVGKEICNARKKYKVEKEKRKQRREEKKTESG